ncbi:hypothetical protein, partial [Pseudomonas helleri]|uniref:hypothetical protein n=1 Tax=Pseudomonas helleri TaxID=1608996 RepID=UPI003F9652A7
KTALNNCAKNCALKRCFYTEHFAVGLINKGLQRTAQLFAQQCATPCALFPDISPKSPVDKHTVVYRL